MRTSWKALLLFGSLSVLFACASSEPAEEPEFTTDESGDELPTFAIGSEDEAGRSVEGAEGSDLGVEDVNRFANDEGVVVMEPESRDPRAGIAGAQDPDLGTMSNRQDPLTIDGARTEIALRAEKRAALANTFVQQADTAFARGDYASAAGLYADAFQLDPDNAKARDGIRRTESALAGGGSDTAEDLMQSAELQWARQRIVLENQIRQGDQMMAAGDFDSAIEKYRGAQLTLQVSPNLAGGSLDPEILEGKLDAAIQSKEDSQLARSTAIAAQAELDAAAEEEAREQYYENRVSALFSEANNHFSLGYYERAVDSLDRILELDPRNEDARDMRGVAHEAWLAQRQRRTTSAFREEWKRTFEELRTIAVPPRSTIEFDVERWRNVVENRQPLDAIAGASEEDPEVASIMRTLQETRIEPRFDDNTVEEIATNLAAYTRVNYVVTRAVREDVDEDTKTIRFSPNRPMEVLKLHKIIEDLTNNEVRFFIENGVVVVGTPDEAKGTQVLRQYEVRDIVRPIADFVGKEINLSPSGGIDEIEELLPDKAATILTDDDLLEAIQENIEPDSWDDEGTISIENGTLIVYHRPDVQERVKRILGDLRKASNIMVEIRVRFLKVEDSFLEDIGVDFRGLGNDATAGEAGKGTDNVFDDFGSDPGSPAAPGRIGTGNDSGLFFREADDNVNIIARTENLYDQALGDENVLTNSGGFTLQYTWLDDTEVEMILRAVEKSKRSEIVTEPKLMVYNTARANLTIANQVSYVGDFDVQIAQAAAIADPIVRVAQDGVYLDVRPTVSADRRFIYIDVRPTVATLQRPIPTFQTSLGTGSPVTLQLPQLEIQKVRTPVIIPDGGTLLLGGMKVVDEQNLDSGVPFLSDVPILSFFFSRKGNFESYRKLIILLTARVVIPSEFEPAPLPGGATR